MKMLKTLLCLVLVVGSLFCLTACGEDEKPTATQNAGVKEYITGRYAIQRIEFEGGVVTSGSALQDVIDQTGPMYIDLYSDGTAQMCIQGPISDMEFADGRIWMKGSPNIGFDFSVSDGILTLHYYNNSKYIFVKQ